MNKIKLLFTATIMTTAMCITSFAGQWKQDAKGWWYQNDDGSYPVNSWLQDKDSKWYYFNDTGYMQTTPITLADGTTYTFDTDGSCTNRWASAADQNYYDRNDGKVKNVGAELTMRDYLNGINSEINGSYYIQENDIN
ncbi:hypothetical protein [Lacrimispora aerotolerans]|jgi:hypothetical protein|uniref:hypothetical protein n=1 Tax=Lacrimispora aerotolerans TaxID=36832 RepID=UPI000557469F|nr:hypothetical protein [Lacrimispora aerotolerans]